MNATETLLIVFASIAMSMLIVGATIMFIRWLMRPPRCNTPKHEWSDWFVCDSRSNSQAYSKVTQRRVCKHCGYVQFNRTTLY